MCTFFLGIACANGPGVVAMVMTPVVIISIGNPNFKGAAGEAAESFSGPGKPKAAFARSAFCACAKRPSLRRVLTRITGSVGSKRKAFMGASGALGTSTRGRN